MGIWNFKKHKENCSKAKKGVSWSELHKKHISGELNSQAKITDKDALNILCLWWNKTPCKKIMKLYPNVSETSLRRIKSGEKWGRVTGLTKETSKYFWENIAYD